MDQNLCLHCGGDFVESEGKLVCRYCGMPQPPVTISTEELHTLYNAYQELNLANFERAEKMFDDIIRKNPRNAQAYWGRLSARYNIKYETDYNGNKVPSCYAVTMEDILEVSDYQNAVEYADFDTRAVYEKHGQYLSNVRKKWIERTEKEEPYDIFISYKDSDKEERTDDSIEMQALYFKLREEGYRVFYSHETLKEIAGEQYEPYIWHALSTAQVMILYGSKAEYINSTWVKNEWSRYQRYIAKGLKQEGSLLVVRRGFSPSELPVELRDIQCLDRDDMGFREGLLAKLKHLIENNPDPTCEHEFETIPGRAPTCTEPGTSDGVRCKKCGYEQKRIKTLPAMGHQFGDWYVSKPVTCVKDGEFTRICKVCGEKETKPIPCVGRHNPSETWETVMEPAPGKKGLKVIKCLTCGEYLEKVEIPALPALHLRFAKGLSYRVNPDGRSCTVLGQGTCTLSNINIPREIDGYTVTAITTEKKNVFGNFVSGFDRSISSVVIPDTVTSIGESAFRDCVGLMGIVIPDSVKTIGWGAFFGCTGLASVTIPDSVTSLGDSAFSGCISLLSATVGNAVKNISWGTFNECERLAIVTLGRSIENIHSHAFFGCKSLVSLIIPDSVTAIHDNAFSGCEKLERITIPDSVSIIEEYAFHDCSNLRSIKLPSNITEIQAYTFCDCSSLTGVDIPDSVKNIGIYAFRNCTKLRNVELPPSVKMIREFTFSGCESLTEITIPNAVTVIGGEAFSCCTHLESITLSDSVTTIGNDAFSCCHNLLSITLPETLTHIGGYAFFECQKLEKLMYAGPKRKWKRVQCGESWKDGSSIRQVECENGKVKVK